MNPSIEETINRVEELYATLTGSRLPQLDERGASNPPPIDPIDGVDEQLVRLRVAVEQLASSTPPLPGWMPAMSAWRDEAGLELTIDIPGMSQEQVEIRLEDRTITVRGQRRAPWGALQARVETCEAPFGSFIRSFTLAMRIDPKQISARLHAGVLHIRVANLTADESSQIPIKS